LVLLALNRGDQAHAAALLQTAAPYELAVPGIDYYSSIRRVRGEAYLADRRGTDAATEFQKILDHPRVVASDPICALAHWQLVRTYGLAGDTTRAKSAYLDFLTIWKDADPDIPILKQAKAEYAKLQ
jgi:eukaryotic-like serine/threonine-protein kinase